MNEHEWGTMGCLGSQSTTSCVVLCSSILGGGSWPTKIWLGRPNFHPEFDAKTLRKFWVKETLEICWEAGIRFLFGEKLSPGFVKSLKVQLFLSFGIAGAGFRFLEFFGGEAGALLPPPYALARCQPHQHSTSSNLHLGKKPHDRNNLPETPEQEISFGGPNNLVVWGERIRRWPFSPKTVKALTSALMSAPILSSTPEVSYNFTKVSGDSLNCAWNVPRHNTDCGGAILCVCGSGWVVCFAWFNCCVFRTDMEIVAKKTSIQGFWWWLWEGCFGVSGWMAYFKGKFWGVELVCKEVHNSDHAGWVDCLRREVFRIGQWDRCHLKGLKDQGRTEPIS